MKKNQITRLTEILGYFRDSIENPVQLTGINLVLISGKNKQPICIETDTARDPVAFHVPLIGKKTTVIGSDSFFELIGQQALLYDGIEIEFHERSGGRKIIADDRNVRIMNMEDLSIETVKAKTSSGDVSHPTHGVSQTRDYLIRTDEATVLLKAIGIIDEKSKVRNDKIRKYNQIDRFVELADPLIQEFIKRDEPIHILDCACGKSYLSFVLNYYISEKLHHTCDFLGLDWSESVIESSRQLAKTLHYSNMKFEQCDLSTYRPDRYQPTLCMSLHACDTATDLAIFTGIRSHSAAILCVPCCQKELLNSDYSIPALSGNILSHGLLKARFSDLMTDALRVLMMEANGYETTLIEYISPLDTPKNIMIKGRFTGRKNQASLEEYQNLKKEYHCDIMLGRLLDKEEISAWID